MHPLPSDSQNTAIRLDSSQRRVLGRAEEQSFAVIGAPGSGKTTTLIELIAKRVSNPGFSIDDIVVIAATRKSAATLRDQIAVRIGQPSSGPLARTVNSIAFQLVSQARAVAADDAPVLLTGADQDSIIADLIDGQHGDGTDGYWPESLEYSVRSLAGFRTELRDLMMRALENTVSPASLDALGTQFGRPEWRAAARFIAEYDQVKGFARPNSYDSAELVREAIAVIRLGELESDAGVAVPLAKPRLVIVDDAAESSRATLELLAEYSRQGAQVVVFGDPDTTTGAFRGAHPEVLGQLRQVLGTPVAAPVILDTIYRHPENIRSVVAAFSSQVGTAAAGTQRKATAVVDDGEPRVGSVESIIATSPSDEFVQISRRLREAHVFGDVPWDAMAVIVRSSSRISEIERALAAFEVPSTVSHARVALRDDEVVRSFLLIVDIALGRITPTAAQAQHLVTGPFVAADALVLRRLKRALRHQEVAQHGTRSSDEILADALVHPAILSGIDPYLASKVERIGALIRETQSAFARGASIEDALWLIWSGLRLAKPWRELALGTGIVADEANDRLDATMALFAAAKRFGERTPDSPASVFVDQIRESDVPEDSLARGASSRAVVITTASATLGKEFELVVVAGVQDGSWPNLRTRSSLLGSAQFEAALAARAEGPTAQLGGADERASVLHDELRMFTQAISRAKATLIVSAVSDENQAPSAFFRLLPDPTPPGTQRAPVSLRRMVAVLRRELVLTGDPSAALSLSRLAHEGVPGAATAEWYGLQALSRDDPLFDMSTEQVRVSPSRMESFETCPLDWLIAQLGGAGSSTTAGLGTLIHSALESGESDASALMALLDGTWGQLRFEADWLANKAHDDAHTLVEALASYLRDFSRENGTLINAESRFSFAIDNALLSGSVDRVEQESDGSIRIVDLKTGKSVVSAASIDQNAQLGAYQLALNRGEIGGVPDGSISAGARLLYVAHSRAKSHYTVRDQAPYGPEQLEAFAERVVADAHGMAAAQFVAQLGSHCRDPHSHGACALHVIRAVTL